MSIYQFTETTEMLSKISSSDLIQGMCFVMIIGAGTGIAVELVVFGINQALYMLRRILN